MSTVDYVSNSPKSLFIESASHNPLYQNELELSTFIHIFDNKVTCYKFYWLEGILTLIAENPERHVFSFDQIIAEMIANAWYTVREYHLHMGTIYGTTSRRNTIEAAVTYLAELTNLQNDASRREVLYELSQHTNDAKLKKHKTDLIAEVPFHFLSPFLSAEDRKILRKIHTAESVIMLNALNDKLIIPYTFSDKQGLDREIIMNESWQAMLLDNIIPLRGWIRYEKIKYLQERNPDAHGIIYKLDPAQNQVRKLKNARALWSALMDVEPLIDIYTDNVLSSSDYELDHFIPWSFLTNDELWDLIPAESSINSQKRNHLPSWDTYFPKFSRNQYSLYKKIYSSAEFYNLFKACQKDNLKSYWGLDTLYVRGKSESEFLNTMEKNLRPQYDSALRQGFSIWSPNQS